MKRNFDIIFTPDNEGNKKDLGLVLYANNKAIIINITEEKYEKIKKRLDIDEIEIPF